MSGEEDAGTGPSQPLLDDERLLEEGGDALQQRLGLLGMIRFLRLVGGGRDRFEDIRKPWADLSVNDTLNWMGRSNLVKCPQATEGLNQIHESVVLDAPEPSSCSGTTPPGNGKEGP